jgi:hypothetical protein
LEPDKKKPSYAEGRVRNASVAARQSATGVRARLMQLLRVAVRKREPQPDDEDEAEQEETGR